MAKSFVEGLQPLPKGMANWLERFRIHTQHQLRTTPTGNRTNRRHGQSREFLEMADYVPGDDVRAVDRMASLRNRRFPQDSRLIVRRFEAEHHYKLLVSVDTLASMRGPEGFSKLNMALWIAEAIARLAMDDGHKVALHRLFGGGRDDLVSLRRSGTRGVIGESLRALCNWEQSTVETPLPSFANANRFLEPAAIWILVTDLYWADDHDPRALDRAAQALAHRIRSAQNGWRWIAVVDVDSWPYERRTLQDGALEISGPGQGRGPVKVQMEEQRRNQIQENIFAYKTDFFHKAGLGLGSRAKCEWPGPALLDPEQAVKQFLASADVMQQLLLEGG